ncbi:MAG: hypothetical protein ACYDAG_19515, partial [Chloroflexota bacterium]
LVAIVGLGALLTATGAILALFASGEHLNAAGRNYADYFITRNLALALGLLALLALRARRLLTVLVVLEALIQSLDALTAIATGRLGLVPVDVVFAATFAIVAAQLSGQRLWRAGAWRALGGEAPRSPSRAAIGGTERTADH